MFYRTQELLVPVERIQWGCRSSCVPENTLIQSSQKSLQSNTSIQCRRIFISLGWHGKSWLSSRNFFRGAKSIVMHISFVMLILLLFLDQISGGRQKSPRGQTVSGGRPLPPVEERQETKKVVVKW